MGAQRVVARRLRALATRKGWLAAAVAILVAALLIPGCERRVPEAAATGAAPRRVVCLAPSATETLVALGLADRIVGISDYCPQLDVKPPPVRVGGLNDLDLEAVLALHPDLVMSVQNDGDRTMAALRAHGVATHARDPQSLDEVFETIVAIGTRFERGDAARTLVAGLRERLARGAAAAPARRPRVYVDVDPQGPWTIGRNSFVRDALVAAGADNLFDDVAAAYPTVSVEAIAERDPDCILVLHPQATSIAERGNFARLRAVREGRVLRDVDRDALLHSSPRLVDGIEALAAKLRAIPAAAPGGR